MAMPLRVLFLALATWRVDAFHVCYGYFGGVADLGWTYNQNLGRAWADATLGTTSYYREGVYFMPEVAQRAVLEEFVHGTGDNPAKCDLVFTGSDVLQFLTLEYSLLYPHVKWVCAAGQMMNANLTGVYPRPYQGYFLGGMLAAMQPGVKKIGYVGSMYSPSSIANVNAVALGMRSVDNTSKLYVQHVGEWFWPRSEVIAGLRMIEQQGVDLLFYDSDSTEIVKLAKEKGIFSIAVKSDGTALHGESNLMSVIYVWNTILVDIIGIAMSNETYWLAEKDRNLFVGVEKDGISTGTFSSHVPAKSRMRVKEQKDKFGAQIDEVWCHASFDTYCPLGARGWERGIWPCDESKTVHTPNLTAGDACLADRQIRDMTWFITDLVEDLGFLEVPSECGAGFKMDALEPDLCVPCEAGKFTDTVDQTECQTCRGGYFNPDINASSCKLCQGGYRTVSPTECRICDPGRFSTGGVSNCSLCPSGYQREAEGGTGLLSCTLCEIGRYASQPGTPLCTGCPTGLTTKSIASDDPSACVCDKGFFQKAGEVGCQECPEGMTCIVGSKESGFGLDNEASPMLLEGFWSSAQVPLSVFECDLGVRCPGGDPGTCKADVDVTACDGCPAGQYMTAKGECLVCTNGKTSFLWVLCCALLIPVVCFVHKAVNHPLLLTQQTGMKAVFLGGMAVTAVLTFSIYEGFNFNWGPPLSGGFEVVKLFSFNMDFLVFECTFGSPDLLPKYVMQLLLVPAGYALLIVSSFLLNKIPATRSFACYKASDLQNTLGHLFAVFLIAMTLMTIEGFKCMPHPSGFSTLYADHTIICWQGSKHLSIVLVSVVAVLVYPVAFLATCGIVVWKYFEWSARYGTDFVFRTRFLVSRMEPSKYFFGYAYIVRNFFLSVSPLTTHNFGAQILIMQLIYFTWMIVQLSMMPWRFGLLNFFDCLNSVMQILILSGLGMMNGIKTDEAGNADLQYGFGWVAILLFIGICSSLCCVAARNIYLRLTGNRIYAFLITHHRAGAGLFARLTKCIIQGELDVKVFLDVDEMADLDNLGFTVRTGVQNLLVLQTSEVYSRPWCAVEITTAQRNKVNILVAEVDGHECILTEEYVTDLLTRWGVCEGLELSNSGMNKKDVEEAYRYVAQLKRYELSMFASADEQAQSLLVITNSKGHYMKRSPVVLAKAKTQPSGIFLVYDADSAVQTCVARIAEMMLRELQWNCVALSRPTDSIEVENVSVVLVLLSAGLTRNPMSLGFIAALQNKGLPFVTAISQEAFTPPHPAWMQKLVQGTALTQDEQKIYKQVAPNISCRGAAGALQELYKVLAWRFDPQQPMKDLREEFLCMVDKGVRTAGQHYYSSEENADGKVASANGGGGGDEFDQGTIMKNVNV